MPKVKMPKVHHALYASLAGISFGLGVVGMFVPLMPTTCFMLLAVWLASKGSPRFALWIRRHPRFGPSIRAWEKERAIPRHAKWLAVAMLGVSMLVLAMVIDGLALRVALIAALAILAGWIYTRPEPLEAPARLSSKHLSTDRPGH